MRISVIAPHDYVGPVMETVTARRGVFDHMEYLQRTSQSNQDNGANGTSHSTSEIRVLLEYELPLSEILTDFYDELKSRTRGYASLDYSLIGYRPAKLVKLDLLINGEPVDALSAIVHSDAAATQGRELADRLRRFDSSATVRCADPGCRRWPDRGPGNRSGHAQERDLQVLRR